jgi:TonB family protein
MPYTGVQPAQQELIVMTPLPPLTSISFLGGLKLNAIFRLENDGSVSEIKLLRASGDAAWDAQAIDSMKQWRFTQLPSNADPKDHVMRLAIVVQTQEPVVMSIGELVSATAQEADSLYELLEKGARFDSLAVRGRHRPLSGNDWYVASVNIARYPENIRKQLARLRVNGFTQPVRVGTHYVIYQRFRCDDPL